MDNLQRNTHKLLHSQEHLKLFSVIVSLSIHTRQKYVQRLANKEESGPKQKRKRKAQGISLHRSSPGPLSCF